MQKQGIILKEHECMKYLYILNRGVFDNIRFSTTICMRRVKLLFDGRVTIKYNNTVRLICDQSLIMSHIDTFLCNIALIVDRLSTI